MFLSRCCSKLDYVWEQLVQAKVYLTQALVSSNQTTDKHWKRSSVEDNSVLMDINQLEVQYDSIRQKQKEQTQVVFRSGKRASGEVFNLQVKTVSVNCTIREPKAFEERLPVNSVKLDFLNKDYTQDGDTPWRTHLDIHRGVQAQNSGQKSHVRENKESDERNHQLGSMSKNGPFTKGVTESCSEKRSSGEVTTHMACKSTELKTIHSFNSHNHSIPKINKRFSFPNERSNIWASKIGLVTRIAPITMNADHYPFPQLKTPRKSDTAKSLGLYAKR